MGDFLGCSRKNSAPHAAARDRAQRGVTRTLVGRGPFDIDGRRGRIALTIGPLDSQTHPRDAVSRADFPTLPGSSAHILYAPLQYSASALPAYSVTVSPAACR